MSPEPTIEQIAEQWAPRGTLHNAVKGWLMYELANRSVVADGRFRLRRLGRFPRTTTPTSGESGRESRSGSGSSYRALRRMSHRTPLGRRIPSRLRAASTSSSIRRGAVTPDGRASLADLLRGLSRGRYTLPPGSKRPSPSTPSSEVEPAPGTEPDADTGRDNPYRLRGRV